MGTEFHFILWGFFPVRHCIDRKTAVEKIDGPIRAGRTSLYGSSDPIVVDALWNQCPGSIEVYTRKLFPFFSADDAIIYVNDFWKNLNDFRFIIPAGFLFSTRLPVRIFKKIRGSVPEIFVYLAIFWASVYCIYVGSNDPFLYFRF